jgi:ABC-type lipoprotein release transport system permease subunit
MSLTMQIGLRNLARQPRRTILTALMLLIGTALAVWMNGISQGSYATFIEGSTNSWLGHFQVLKGDYNDKPTLYKSVDNPAGLLERLSGVEGVRGATARIESAGLLAVDNRTVGALLLGVDPVREPKTTTLSKMVKRGSWFGPGGPPAPDASLPMILGAGVAKRLKVDVGGEVSFVGQAADGSIAAELFEVVGILESGSAEMDGSLSFVRLRDAQEVLALENRVHRIIGTVHATEDLPEVMARLPRPPAYRVMDWTELNPGLYNAIKADRDSGQIMLWVVMLVAVLGVANTMLMSVFERTREFGLMIALGTSPRRVVAITLWEVIWLSACAVVLGALLGAAATRFVTIPLPEPFEWGGVVISEIAGKNTPFGSVLTPLLIFIASLLSGLWPARRASRLDPVVALRTV